MKYSANIDLQDPLTVDKLDRIFLKHYEEICNAYGLSLRKVVAMVREGMFFKDLLLIDKSFEILKDLGDKNWISND